MTVDSLGFADGVAEMIAADGTTSSRLGAWSYQVAVFEQALEEIRQLLYLLETERPPN